MGWPKPPKPWNSPAAVIFYGDGGASTGMGLIDYSAELTRRGYDSRIFKHTEWKYAADQLSKFRPSPIVCVGYSAGGTAAIRCAERCGLTFRLMYLLEPTQLPYPASNPPGLPSNVALVREVYVVPQTPLTRNPGPRVLGSRVTHRIATPPMNHLSLHSERVLLAEFLDLVDRP